MQEPKTTPTADEAEVAALRAALAQAIGIGERIQQRVDAALELLEQHADDPVVQVVIDRLEGHS